MPRPAEAPDGHFYSPVVDPDEIALRAAAVWPDRPEALGLEFNDDSHHRVLTDHFPRYFADYDYEEEAPSGDEELLSFYTRNSQFSWLDCRSLFVLLRAWAPRRIIEVGSGYSSLLMADVNARFLGGRCEITCIEPFPRPFLLNPSIGISRLIQEKVQYVALDEFRALGAGDILFIDSSHVCKTGSDVNHLFFEVLPRLARGVRVHVHDVFLPHEYPRDWVVDANRSWNEQYLLRALLMYSSAFRIVFGSNYAFHRFPDEVARALGRPSGRGYGGGSLWIERL